MILDWGKNGGSFPFGDLLHRSACGDCGDCGDCGEGLKWGARLDADGTSHSAECCGKAYAIYPDAFRLEIDEWGAAL
jgi:hypothetical protein